MEYTQLPITISQWLELHTGWHFWTSTWFGWLCFAGALICGFIMFCMYVKWFSPWRNR